jgi:rubrerythrin
MRRPFMREPKDLNTVDEILDFAIEKEQEAFDFYTLWSGKVEDKAIGDVFIELAENEKAHKAFLTDVKSGKKIPPEPREITNLSIADYLVEIEPTPDMDYQSALMVAMQREKSANQLYSNLAAKVTVQEVKNTLLTLAAEEAKHRLRLETIYDDEVLRNE